MCKKGLPVLYYIQVKQNPFWMTTTVYLVGNKTPITIIFGEGGTPTANGGTETPTVQGETPTTVQGETPTAEEKTVKSKTHLFPDDTILTIKQKILEELQGVLPNEDGPFYSNDLYLFATVYRHQKNPAEWVQHIQKQSPTQKQIVFKQVLSNLGYSKEKIDETSVSIPQDTASYSLEPWIINQARVPLGIRPVKTHAENAEFFPVHPFESYSYDTDVEWVSHQNEVLLEYGELVKPVLYACLYKDIPEETRNKYGMTKRAVKTTPQTKSAWRKMDNQQVVNDWTPENNPIQNKSVGITYLELEWIHPQYAVLPLEVIFKNIHANKLVPFIKWKNMFRLYCPTRDERGNKVPQLSKTEIAKIDRENIIPQLILWTDRGVVLQLMKNGNLQIHVDQKTPISVEGLQQVILETAEPVVRQLNQYLQKTGFSYQISWDTLFKNDPTVVRLSNIRWNYSAKLEMETTLQKKLLGHLDPAFVLLKANAEKKVSQAYMTYRRVSNYDPMNELKEIVRLELSQNIPTKSGKIVSELEERGFTRDKIQVVIQEVLEELQAGKQYFQKKEKKFGCPTIMVQIHDKIQFTVDNIPFLENTRLLQEYVEAFIQQVFYKKKLPKSLIYPLVAPFEVPVIEPVIIAEEPQEEDEDEATGILLKGEEKEEGEEGEEEEEEEDDDVSGVLLFNDDDEEEEGDDRQTMKEMLQMNIPDVEESPSLMAGGAKKTNASFSILNRLKERDPELFDVPDKNGKVYSRICPGSSSRYPIVLSKDEKTRIDKKDGELNQMSYTEPLEYKNNTYVCPRYWNFRENRSMNQAEFDRNPTLLQNLIVDEKDIKNDANDRFIYEFKKGKRFDKNNRYKEHVPGFSSKNKKGFCLPCCFSEKDATFKKNIEECKAPVINEEKDEEKDEEMDEEKDDGEPGKPVPKEKVANANYILGINIYPLEANRWGQIPPPIQNFINNQGKKQGIIKDTKPLLRYGVERQGRQSFLACLADLFNISVKEIKKQLTTKVITLDRFVQYQTGVIASRFSSNRETSDLTNSDTEKYQETAFYKSLDLENPDEMGFLMDTLRTYEQFIYFLNSDNSDIDHTYLWDVIATPDENLFSTGLNIIIMEIVSNEDTKLHIACPTQFYSNTVFYNDAKPTWILVKRPLLSGEEYYEPIYMATKKNGARGAVIKDKVFLPDDAESLFPFLKTLDNTACFSSSTTSSVENKGPNPREITAKYVFDLFQKQRFQIKKQVVNRYGKTAGFVVDRKTDGKQINDQYIPCFPSVFLQDKTSPLGIERVRLNIALIQKPLKITLENLQGIQSKTGLPCRSGAVLVVRYGDNPKVIGIKTGYVGYIPVVPESYDPSVPIAGLPVEYSSDPIEAEMNSGDETGQPNDDFSQKYFLENEFFLAFQGKMRNLLNEYRNEPVRRQILRWIHYKPTTTDDANTVGTNATFTMRHNRVLFMLRQVADGRVIFNDFDPRVLNRLRGVFACQPDASQRTEAQPYCLLRQGAEGGEDKMVFPKKNLVNSADDNEIVYFSKLADALVRNHRIQNIVFQPFRFFNMLGSIEYQVNDDELLVG